MYMSSSSTRKHFTSFEPCHRTLYLLNPLPSDERFRRHREAFLDTLGCARRSHGDCTGRDGSLIRLRVDVHSTHLRPDPTCAQQESLRVFRSPAEPGQSQSPTLSLRLISPLLLFLPFALRPRISTAPLAWATYSTLKSARTSSSTFQRPKSCSFASIGQRLSTP